MVQSLIQPLFKDWWSIQQCKNVLFLLHMCLLRQCCRKIIDLSQQRNESGHHISKVVVMCVWRGCIWITLIVRGHKTFCS
jgi:hypothetical protein